LHRKNKQRKRNAPSHGPGKGAAEPQTGTIVKVRDAGNGYDASSNKKSERNRENVGAANNVQRPKEVDADKPVAVFIAILAVILAVCSMGGDNAAQDMTYNNILASDTWAHYQAKKLRETNYQISVDALELKLAAEPNISEEARIRILNKISDYKAQAARLKSNPAEGDGRKQLMAKAKTYEAERDIAMRRGPYFDYGTALLQIAIVLASASIIFGGRGILLTASVIVGAAGIGLMVNGFTLVVNVPFIG
jgi:hypothetical protein